MTHISSIPRFVQPGRFRENPLDFLRQAAFCRSKVVLISEATSIFSRVTKCAGVIAVFDADGVREVLTQPHIFVKGRSIGQRLELPPRLRSLNSGLFSMRGARHARHQKLVASVFNQVHLKDYQGAIRETVQAFLGELQSDSTIPLLAAMHRLALLVSERLVFGSCGRNGATTGELIRGYFDARKGQAAGREPHGEGRRELIALGHHTDAAVRATLYRLLSGSSKDPACDPIIVRLARAAERTGIRLTSDELVMHANMLFMAGSEPVGTALSWIFLVLSQQPLLRRALRAELTEPTSGGEARPPAAGNGFRLIDAVVHESLRLFPPNAVTVRVTCRATAIQSQPIPRNCEIVVSPFVAHRDPDIYPAPDNFDPFRWRNLKPSPYAYFPYGVGGHYCLGRHLAHLLICMTLQQILPRCDVILSEDQSIDWKVDVTLKPCVEPMVRVLSPTSESAATRGGRLWGPVAELVRFSQPERHC